MPPSSSIPHIQQAQSSCTSNTQSNNPVPIPKLSAPPKETPKPVTRQAEAVASNLKHQNFLQAKLEAISTFRPSTNPKKGGPFTSSTNNSSPSTIKKIPNQLTLDDYLDPKAIESIQDL
jgi:hypothetical protein